MSRARGEEGVAMIMTVIILFVLMGLGTALLVTANAQQRSAANQQSGETAYSLAEAALNAQLYELSQQWPTQADAPQPSSAPTLGYPTSCNAASAGTSFCPTASDLSAAYSPGSGTCPTGTPGDAWSSSSSVSNGWTTYVRDAGATGSPAQQLFTDSGEQSAVPYDTSYGPTSAAGNAVWVRAVGIVNCHTAVVITKVSAQFVPLTIPDNVVTANGFQVSDNGQKLILNTQDGSSNVSQLDVRCTNNGSAGPPPSQACANYNSTQVQPSVTWTQAAPSTTLTQSQLQAAKALAIQNGTYFPPNDCPTSDSQLVGSTVYVDGTGCSTIQITGNGTANSLTSPGLLVIANAAIDFKGSTTYYGVIYDANLQQTAGPVVTLGGTTTVVGGVDVDGAGTISLGSSGNGLDCTDSSNNHKCGDLEFNFSAFLHLEGFGGAAPTPNTFRQLPVTQ